MMQFWSSLLTACITAPLTAWLTYQFAVRRFYSEKIWERKAAAYTAIFDALHDLRKWFGEHQDALEEDRQIPKDEQTKLAADSREAKARLARELDRENWLLPPACDERLARMRRELDYSTTDWVLYLQIGWNATDSALKDMHALARDNLEIDRPGLIEKFYVKIKQPGKKSVLGQRQC